MNFDWKKILGIHGNVPRSSYILRIIVGAYLLYLVYQIVGGLGTPSDTKPTVMIVAAVLFTLGAIFCLLSGGLGMYLKEYREAQTDEKAESSETETNKGGVAESPEAETVETDKEDEVEKAETVDQKDKEDQIGK